MSAEIRAHLAELVARALAGIAPDVPAGTATIERPRDPGHGDYATTVALQVAKALKSPPRTVAERLVAALPASDWIERPEIAGPGFVNFRLRPLAKRRAVRAILERGADFGRSDRGRGAAARGAPTGAPTGARARRRQRPTGNDPRPAAAGRRLGRPDRRRTGDDRGA